MYKIVYGASVLYDDTMPHDKEYQIIDFKLSMQDNKAGSLTMTVPPTNGEYDNIKQTADHRVAVFVYVMDEIVWHGRVTSVSVDIFGRLNVFCEGALSWLADALYQGYPAVNSSEGSYKLETAWSKLNSILSGYQTTRSGTPVILEDYRMDGFTDMEIDGEADASYHIPACAPDTSKTCLQRLQDVQKKYGGHFTVKYQEPTATRPMSRLYWYANEWGGNTEGSYAQTANFGENLLNYVRTVSTDDIFTVIRPYGENRDNAPNTATAKTNIFSDTTQWTQGQRIGLTGLITTDASLTRSYVARITVETGKTYYYSGHMYGNYATFAVHDANGVPIFVKSNYGGDIPASAEKREHKDIEIPLTEDAVYIYVGFWNDTSYNTEHSVTMIDYSNVGWISTTDEVNKDAYRVTVGSVNGGEDFMIVDWTLYGRYGWIERRVDFPHINKAEPLFNAASKYIDSLKFNTFSIEVSFIDLAAMGVVPQPLRLFDGVRVRTAVGEEYIMYVTKIDLSKNPANSKITLGTSLSRGISSLV